jgi:hypothetical protein
MNDITASGGFHYSADLNRIIGGLGAAFNRSAYNFATFTHPFAGDLIRQLNQASLAGMLDPDFLSQRTVQYAPAEYTLLGSPQVTVTMPDAVIDTSVSGPYACYNWELLYHIPVTTAVHLSNNQRFAEAQKWFHLVFDPTDPGGRYWKSFAFSDTTMASIDELIALLSTPDGQLADPALIATKQDVLAGYAAILGSPYQPYPVARTRQSAFQWSVVMAYLDNLIAWGDSLFLADTIETLNEATLCYVLAAQLLGPRPQSVPRPGGTTARNFAQLKQGGLDAMSDAMVTIEGQFPFNLGPGPGSSSGSSGSSGQDASGVLFGIGRSLYFAIPPNPKLLGYWDTVADRLFKIRNSENIAGVAQQLPLFDPPIDPGMLVKATAAGLDVGSIVSGISQPAGPVRALLLIQKSLEIAGEVRSLGATLLSALEKGDAEQLALKRQDHEVTLQHLLQHTRYLQYQHAMETTNALLRTRDSVVERYTYYLSLLGQAPDQTTVPAITPDKLDRQQLTEKNFDDVYATLLAEYDLPVPTLDYPDPQLAHGSSPSDQSGATGQGQLYLNKREDTELNTNLPLARDARTAANAANAIATVVTPVPEIQGHAAYWGIGFHTSIINGNTLGAVARLGADIAQVVAAWQTDQAAIAARTAGYQRRVEEWTLQANLAARELRQLGRQVVASLIAEQVARHDYATAQKQVDQAKDIQAFLKAKVTSADFYTWMQSDLTGLYYQYYRFACDTARKAEQTMKYELMRPGLDATQFIQYNYWDSGHQGLLSGEALYLDVKRMELAYHDSNTRELELTRHVSLRQLDPLALLALKVTGSCTVTVPEWLYDWDGPGHYMRRIKALAVSVPSVVGPNTSLNLTATLQSSTIRVSPAPGSGGAAGGYARTGQDDSRFQDYFGSTDVIVTSGGVIDSGMFETNLHDERFLPFEGAGAVSTWNLSLPAQVRSFDYLTISDLILHIRYTARDAGNPLRTAATSSLKGMLKQAGSSGQALLFNLRYDFPTEWSAFVNGTGDFTVTLAKSFFPYAVQAATGLTIDSLTLYTGIPATTAAAPSLASVIPQGTDLAALSAALTGPTGEALLPLPADDNVLTRDLTKQVFLVMQYRFTVSYPAAG